MATTTSSIFLDTLEAAGITHCFVNLGSDHPAMLEAFISRAKKGTKRDLNFITSPNESVALNCAQGYYQACGKPAAVIVHVDCGTQALAGAVHNVAACRVPVLIYAGASPFTLEGELLGSRNEFIHYLQNANDQPSIVRQYVKHVAEIRTPRNTQQVVLRALQIAQSEPKGPVYCWAAREVTEEHLEPSLLKEIDLKQWEPTDPIELNPSTVEKITSSLLKAKSPLIVTGYVGRNPKTVPLLVELSEKWSIPVFQSCATTMNFPANNQWHAGFGYNAPNPLVEQADWVLVLDSDIPWLPLNTKPRKDAYIIHIDCDVLKNNMQLFYIPAQLRAQADAELSLTQIIKALEKHSNSTPSSEIIQIRKNKMRELCPEIQEPLSETGGSSPLVPNIVTALRKFAPKKHLVMSESISNYTPLWEYIKATEPGSVLTSGASSLGWGIGASMGAILAGTVHPECAKDLVTLVCGDGSFIFGVPSAAYWMSRRYKTPFLCIILNNGGWKSPTLSMLGVYPNGPGSKSTAVDLNVSFGPEPPHYGKIAEAAGGAWWKQVTKAEDTEAAIKEAIRVVTQDKRCAVLDFFLEKFMMPSS